MRVLFLDIDGVLNHGGTLSSDAPWRRQPGDKLVIPLEPACVARLNRLVVETDARIVVSSSWRAFARYDELGGALVRQGLVGEVVGEIPDFANDGAWQEAWRWWRERGGAPELAKFNRGAEIGEWLLTHPEVGSFAIVDDDSDMGLLGPHLVRTDPSVGLSDPDVVLATRLLIGDLSTDGSSLAAWLRAREAPARGRRVVVATPGRGVYLGNRADAEFWSRLDAVGDLSAVTFASAFDAWRHMRTWGDGPPEGASTHEVEPDEVTPDGVYASVRACVAAGLAGWIS